jgi:tRNA(fMet)-specific endonuclease VapC
VLDTNAASAMMRGDARVLTRLRNSNKRDVSVLQPVLAEIAYGIERLPRSKRRTSLEARFELVRSELPRAEWSDAVSERFGIIKAQLEKRGRRIEDFDAAIAAHALATGAILVSANAADMLRAPGLVVEDWSNGGAMKA